MILSLICIFSLSASLNGGFTTAAKEPGINDANNRSMSVNDSTIPILGSALTTNKTVNNSNTSESSSPSLINTNQTIPVAGSNSTENITSTIAPVTNSSVPPNSTQTTTSMPVTNVTEITTLMPVTNSTVPVTNGSQTTTSIPVTNSTQTTTSMPVTNASVATTPEIKPGSTTVPVFSTNVTPVKDRRFDGPSFIGGIVLSLGTMAIGFVALKFYKARTEVNYHTL